MSIILAWLGQKLAGVGKWIALALGTIGGGVLLAWIAKSRGVKEGRELERADANAAAAGEKAVLSAEVIANAEAKQKQAEAAAQSESAQAKREIVDRTERAITRQGSDEEADRLLEEGKSRWKKLTRE